MLRVTLPLSATILSLFCVAANCQVLSPYGSQTCAKWSELHSGAPTSDTVASDNWVLGYVGGMSRYADAEKLTKGLPASNARQGLNGSSVIALVSQFCQRQPQRTLQSMVSEVTGEMIADPARHASSSRAAAVETTGSAVETTGSSAVETTGSIGSSAVTSKCRVIAVRGSQGDNLPAVRLFHKC